MAQQQIEKVGVLGAGLMGHGIAQVAAQAGYEVVLREVDDATLAKGIGKIEKQLARAVEKGKSTQEDADAVRARINGTTDYGELADCDLVIEAITESLPLKLEMWKEVDRDRQGGGGVRDEHLLAVGDRPGGGHRPAGAVRRVALLQPRAGDEAGRGRALRDHLRRGVRHRAASSRSPRASWRFGRRTGRGSSSTGCSCRTCSTRCAPTKRASARWARSTRR